MLEELLVSLLFIFFFFFQAEDGIRDLTVTGVQTCALPISPRTAGTSSRRAPRGSGTRIPTTRQRSPPPCRTPSSPDRKGRRIHTPSRAGGPAPPLPRGRPAPARSCIPVRQIGRAHV